MATKPRNRAISLDELERSKFTEFDWDGEWFDFFGDIGFEGVMLVWGESGNGKTTFALKLCKYLASKGKKSIYDSLEQGRSKSMQKQIKLAGLTSANTRKGMFNLLDKESIDELKIRLRKKHSADFIVIDSLQYSGMNYKAYQELKDEFAGRKLIMLISHAEGRRPAGRVATSIRYDADIKIQCEGYRASCLSRLGGGKPYTIWHEAAAKYYNENL